MKGLKRKNGTHHRALALLACAIAFAGCATDPAPVEDRSLGGTPFVEPASVAAKAGEGSYRVVRGDTLYAIAFKRGLDYRDVAAWNGIAPPYRILVGQELRLIPSANGPRIAAVANASATSGVSATPSNMPSAKPANANSATIVAGAASASKAGGMFEDVPSQFSPPAHAPETVASAAPVTQEKPTAATASDDETQLQRSLSPQKSSAANAASSTSTEAAAPTAAVATSKPVAAALPAAADPSNAPAKVANDSATASTAGVTWRWPSSGKLLGGFIGGDQTKQGVDIGGNEGDPVRAAADGEIVYSGNGLIGYGELIIVKHNASFLSAYGHNRKRLVQEGEKVKAGQQIAEMGSSASSRDELHFEIRKNGKPVNPLEYLPAR